MADLYVVTEGANNVDSFETIQAALDAAGASGDVIHIVAGSFTGNLTIDKSVTIVGAQVGNAASSTVARAGGETVIADGQWTITAAGVVIDGLAFERETAGSAIVAQADGIQIANSILTGAGAEGAPVTRGIETIGGAANVTVTGNAIADFVTGIYVNPTSGPLIIQNNLIKANWAGIGSDGMGGTTIANNSFVGNVGEGIGASSTAAGNSVTGNSFDLVPGTNAVNNYGGETIGASANWVGSDDIRVVQTAFVGGVTISSFTASGTDSSAAAGFQPDAAALVNVIYDLPGNGNTPAGTAGNDWFVSAGGNDTVNGAGGIDTYDGSANTNGFFADLNAGIASGGIQTGTDTLTSIENLAGGQGNDTLYGDAGDNVFFASAGDDLIDGRGGNDTYNAGHLTASSNITIDLAAGEAHDGSAVGDDLLMNIENAIAGAGNDTLIGTTGVNILVGGAGDDTIAGGGAADTINAGAGADTVVFGGDYDAFTITRDAGTGDLIVDDGVSQTRVSDAEVLRFDDLDVHVVGGSSETATIQAGVTAAVDGDVVLVAPGTYAENVAIAGKSISLISMDGRDTTTIQGAAGSGLLGTVDISGATDGLTIGGAGAGFTIVGYDVTTPGIEHAALYVRNSASGHANLTVAGNDIRADGEGGLLAEYNAKIDGMTIDGNVFSGKTFVGETLPGQSWGGGYFGAQFTEQNLPRQLVAIGGGAGVTNTQNVTFTNNEVTGTAGALDANDAQRGNNLVTIDVVGGTIDGNSFSGFTYAAGLRSRGPGTEISNNTFDNSGAGFTNGVFVQNADPTATYAGNVFIGGDADADVWSGTPGSDVMSGGDGDDAFVVTAADFDGDQIDGGAGQDTLVVSGGGTFDMNDGTVTNVEAVALTAPTAFTADDTAGLSITGSAGADTVILGAGGQTVEAGAGDDDIVSGAGADTIEGGAGSDTVTVIDKLSFAGGAWTLTTADGTDTLTGVEAVQFDDALVWLADGAVRTAQDAVADAGVGDTVLMATGVHTGTLTIDKSLTLQRDHRRGRRRDGSGRRHQRLSLRHLRRYRH